MSSSWTTVPTAVTAIVVTRARTKAGLVKIASYARRLKVSGHRKNERVASSDSVANDPAMT